MLRISAGALKGLTLTVPTHIRSTEGKVRQALFNILGPRLPDCRVLDAFAGSGALGLEALSRGARFVAFIESDARCVRAIQDNLARVPPEAIAGQWLVLPGDVLRQLRSLGARGEAFDLVLCDPPYGDDAGKKALHLVGGCGILARFGVVCLEHAASQQVPAVTDALRLMKQHRYGGTVLSFYEPAMHASPQP